MSNKSGTTVSAYSVQCVHCQAVLKSPTPVPAGKTVKCPKCKQSFTTPGNGASAPVSPAAAGSLDGDAEMAAAIAKLQGDGGLGAAPAPPPPPAPVPAPSAASPVDDDDEMAAAIAKLQGDGGLGTGTAPAPQPAIPDMEIPEIDDDLVVPDEVDVDVEEDEEPAPKKKQPADGEEEPRSKKKKRRDDAEDEDRLRKKPSKRDEDEDNDEAPHSKKKVKKADEEVEAEFEMEVVEEEEEAPRSKKKSKRRDEDEDDEPRSKKKSKREDDEKEDDESRSKATGKQKKAGSPMLLIGLIGGGVLGLLLCCVAGIGGYLLFPRGNQNIVGRWEMKEADFAGIMKFSKFYEFREDGSGIHNTAVGRPDDKFTYRVEEGSPRVLVINQPPIDMEIAGKKMVFAPAREERHEFNIRGDILTLSYHNIGGGSFELTFHRTK